MPDIEDKDNHIRQVCRPLFGINKENRIININLLLNDLFDNSCNILLILQ